MTEDSTSSVKPKPLSRRLRFEILRRDGHTCRYCGAKAPDATLHVDHVTPVTLGGTNDPANLVTACKDCNSGKGSTSPGEHVVADVSDLAVRMSAALDQVSAKRSADLRRQDDAAAKFDEVWRAWRYNGDKIIWRPDDWIRSIHAFASNSLNADDLAHFVGATMRSPAGHYDKWRYFCGCCWKEIAARQEEARLMIAAATIAPKVDDTSGWADPDCIYCAGNGILTNDGTYTECHCIGTTPSNTTTGAL